MELEAVLSALEKVPELLESNRRIERLLAKIVDSLPTREFYTASEVCQMLGISRDQARARPYLLPNYGKSDFPGRVRKWLPATVQAWLEVPPVERERSWVMLPEIERRRIMEFTP